MSSHSNQSSPQSLQAPPLGGGEGLRICVLQPDYSTSSVDYQNYDPPRELSHLMPNALFTNVFLNKQSHVAVLRSSFEFLQNSFQ